LLNVDFRPKWIQVNGSLAGQIVILKNFDAWSGYSGRKQINEKNV